MPDKCVVDPTRDCLGLAKAEALERQLSEYREQARSTHEKLYDRLRDLERSEAARNEQYKQILEKLDKLVKWQEEQKSLPAKRWNAVIEKVLLVAAGALATAVLGLIGLTA